jgi:hypothetical protein
MKNFRKVFHRFSKDKEFFALGTHETQSSKRFFDSEIPLEFFVVLD